MDPDDAMTHDLTTTLRSELAALEYKRDRLMSEVNRLSFLRFDNRSRSNQFGPRLAAGNEKRREIAGPEGRGATGRGGSASRASSQAECRRLQSQEAHSG